MIVRLKMQKKNTVNIPGFPNYAVTRDGRVWSKPRIDACGRLRGGQWLTPTPSERGYLFVRLGGKSNPQPVHRLMLETFVGRRPEGMECRHLDGNKRNNKKDNLCWGTRKENQRDRKRHGTATTGMKHPMRKLNEEQVRVIFQAYHDGYYTQREIAKAFGIAQTTVSAVIQKRVWVYLWNN